MTRKAAPACTLVIAAPLFLALTLLTLLVAPAEAQTIFHPPVRYNSEGWAALSIATGDVNGDHIPDLVVAHSCQSSGTCNNGGWVTVLLGNGDGTFQEPVGYSSGGYVATSVAMADLRGIGKLDLVVTNCENQNDQCSGNGEVSVLLGNGDGTFQAPVSYSSGGSDAGSLAIADLRGVGKLDLVVGNNNALGVLLGNGDGTFQAPVSYSPGGWIASGASAPVAIGDLTGTGKLDLVTGTYYSLAVLLGNGDGTFQPPVTFGPGSGGLALGDVNGDGKLDLINNNGEVNVLLGNGDGTFQAPAIYSSGGRGGGSVAIAKVTGNANPDIVVANSYSNTVSVLPNNGDGTFAQGVTYPPGGGFQPTGLAIVDLNGDGKLDLAVSNLFDAEGPGLHGSVGVLLNKYIADATTAVTSSLNPSRVDQPVTFTATIISHTLVPDGTVVTFYDGATEIGTGTTTSGVATIATSSLAAKKQIIKASYPGTLFTKASWGTVTQVVNLYPTTTALSTSPSPSNYGDSVTLTAQVAVTSSTAPTGKVLFKNGTTVLGTVSVNASGAATLTKTTLPPGPDVLTATYNGDYVNGNSTSPTVTQVVNQAQITMSLSSSKNPSTQGNSVKFTATLASTGGVLTGQEVSFSYDSTTLGTGVVSGDGKASLSITTLPLGSDVVTANYEGDADYAAASASITQTVK